MRHGRQIKQRLRPLLAEAVVAAVREARYFYTSYVLFCLAARSSPTSLILDCLDLHRLAMLFTLSTLLLFLNSTWLAVFNTFALAPLPLSLGEHLATHSGLAHGCYGPDQGCCFFAFIYSLGFT